VFSERGAHDLRGALLHGTRASSLALHRHWITVVSRATGTFTGEMTLPNGKVIAPTGKAYDVEFGQTSKWDGDRLIIIAAFWDASVMAKQLGIAG
jgi:hypothetical protein